MAYISYNKLWESEFDNIDSERQKLQDMNINQLKLEVHDTYKKVEKISTCFKAVNGEDVINKAYLVENLSKTECCLLFLQKDYNEFKLQYNKQPVEELSIQRAVKTTIQLLYGEALFDNYAIADKISEDFLFVTRHRRDLEQNKRCYSLILFTNTNFEKATTNIQIYEVLKKIGLDSKLGVYLRDDNFSSNFGILNFHPSKRTHWVFYIEDCYFDLYGCPPDKKFSIT